MWNSAMKERAMFIGKNSCGFINGIIYNVTIRIDNRRIFINGIPYDTICALNKNWKFLGI